MIRIILIRHGRTAWNVPGGQGKRFRGTIDLPLAGEGVAQAQATAVRLADQPLAAVYSSPLQRAERTAQIIAEPHGLPVRTMSGLGSMDYGDWAGKLDTDVARLWPKLYHQWRQDPFSIDIPGGESTQALRQRAILALHEVLDHHGQDATIALVSHQVVTKTLICAMTGLPNAAYWTVQQDLCNLSRFGYDPVGADYDPQRDPIGSNRFTVVGLNDTCHLSPELPGADIAGTRLVLIRHGQTAWNVGAGEERFRGRTDLPLDETGQTQAHAVAGRLQGEHIAALYTSPLLRTRQTITPLADSLSVPVQPHDGLMDIDYGDLQGMTHSEAAQVYPELYRLWRNRPSRVRFPNGGSLADVQARLQALLHELVARHPEQTVVLTGHQIVNKVLTCMFFGLDLDQIWRIGQDPASISVYQRADGDWHTNCLNDRCHLP